MHQSKRPRFCYVEHLGHVFLCRPDALEWAHRGRGYRPLEVGRGGRRIEEDPDDAGLARCITIGTDSFSAIALEAEK